MPQARMKPSLHARTPSVTGAPEAVPANCTHETRCVGASSSVQAAPASTSRAADPAALRCEGGLPPLQLAAAPIEPTHRAIATPKCAWRRGYCRLLLTLLLTHAASAQNASAPLPCECITQGWVRTTDAPAEVIDAYPIESCVTELRRRCSTDGDAAACTFLNASLLEYLVFPAPHMAWGEAVADLAGQCGMPWLTTDTMAALRLQKPVWDWSVFEAATLVVFNTGGLGLPQNSWTKFIDNWISGATWMAMQVADWVAIGIPYGMAVEHTRGFADYIETTFRGPPLVNGEPTLVSLYLSVERLIDVAPPEHYQVELLISISWRDPRISQNCQGVLLDSELNPEDPCTVFWRPQLSYPTALLGEEEPQIVEDFGTWFYAGEDSSSRVKAPRLERSFGHSSYRLRAKFLTVMDYRRYPYDAQSFNLTVLTSKHSASQVQIYGQVAVDIKPDDRHPVWDVVGVSVVSGWRPELRLAYDRSGLTELLEETRGRNPALEYIMETYSEATQGLSESRAYAEITLAVSRYCGYYLGNYIVLEVILVLLGWITFFMSPESVESRLGIALTLVLAINVFQIVLVENLPETGYLTDLSVFTICNTLILALAATESVIVGEAAKTVKHNDAICRSTRVYMNDPRAIRAAKKIQRWVRFRFRVADALGRLTTSRSRTPSLTPHLASIAIAAAAEELDSPNRRKRPEPVRVHRRKNRVSRFFSVVRMKWTKFYNKHARGIAGESDRICAFIIFPAIFATYTAAIFARPSDGRSSAC